MKKLKIQYGDSVFALPRESLMTVLPSAGGFELKVLIIAAGDDSLRSDYDAACERMCRMLDCTSSALARALEFWRAAGVLDVCESDGAEASHKADDKGKKVMQVPTIPAYTESQTADVMESHAELADVIDACQQIVGKIFTPAEAQTVVGIYDYLGLSDVGYIETLYSYCKANGKTSPRYIEKVALSMHDEGINTTEALGEYIKRREKYNDIIGEIRTLIGAGARQLTPKEKKTFDCWVSEWHFDIAVITRAYEITVDNIGEYKIAYMNRIMENWYNVGLHTVEAIDESLAVYQKKKNEAAAEASGFETDEYFEAALARSQKYLEKNRVGKNVQ